LLKGKYSVSTETDPLTDGFVDLHNGIC